jgi:anaerobic ribonucleoside-triphosphate reductase activating protein
MEKTSLRIHRFLPTSRVNGPGARAVIWVQGCSLGCPGCFNPETHPALGGERVPVHELFERIAALMPAIEGITVSGGEPLQQRRPLLSLLRRVRAETALSVLLFTGYRWEELQRMPEADALIAVVDVLVAGRFDIRQRLARDLHGSANKSVHFLTPRYSASQLEAVPAAEVISSPGGEVFLSGIDPVQW